MLVFSEFVSHGTIIMKSAVLTIPGDLMNIRNLVLAAFVMVGSASAFATTISLTFVKSTNGHTSLAYDSVTGAFYERGGYSGSDITYQQFNSAADFESDSVNSTVSLSGVGAWGTYQTASNGQLLGRTNNSNSATGKWDLGTGNLVQTGSVAGMGGLNGTHTFDWGGYSGVNFMQDQTGIYVVGEEDSGGDWQVSNVDTSLNVLSTKTFTPQNFGFNNYGFGFMISGQLFLGRDYNSGAVVDVFDFASGTLYQNAFDLQAPANYWGSTIYDTTNDTLYMNAVSGTTGVYKVDSASSAFGVAVPAPAPLALFGLGLLALGIRRKFA